MAVCSAATGDRGHAGIDDLMTRRWLRVSLFALLGLTLLFFVGGGPGTIRALRLLQDMRWSADEFAEHVAERVERVDGVPVLVYRPRDATGPLPAILLCHGATPAGARDTRFVPLARALAKAGFLVACPDLNALGELRIDVGDPGRIASVARWLIDRPEKCRGGRVALAGVSIGGAYCLVAAADPDLAADVSAVLALGSYESLERILMNWMVNPPRDEPGMYDAFVEVRRLVFLGNVERLLPLEDRTMVRRALRSLLRGEAISGSTEGLSAGGQRLLECSISTDPIDPETAVAILAPMAADIVALTPGREDRAPTAPVFLLHGASDPIIGPEESHRLAAVLKAAGTRVRVHVTDVFDHVDAGEVSLLSSLSLARFLAGFLAAAEG